MANTQAQQNSQTLAFVMGDDPITGELAVQIGQAGTEAGLSIDSVTYGQDVERDVNGQKVSLPLSVRIQGSSRPHGKERKVDMTGRLTVRSRTIGRGEDGQPVRLSKPKTSVSYAFPAGIWANPTDRVDPRNGFGLGRVDPTMALQYRRVGASATRSTGRRNA